MNGPKLGKIKIRQPRTQAPIEPINKFTTHTRTAWTKLIRKIYEADPLKCPKYHGPMQIIALIDDPPIIQRILEHLKH